MYYIIKTFILLECFLVYCVNYLEAKREEIFEKRILYIGKNFDVLPMFASEREVGGGGGVFYVCSGLLNMKENHMNYYYLQRIYFLFFLGWFDIDTVPKRIYNFQDHISIAEIGLEFKRKAF